MRRMKNFPGKRLDVNKPIRLVQLLSELKKQGVDVKEVRYNSSNQQLIIPENVDEAKVQQVLNDHKPAPPIRIRRRPWREGRIIAQALRESNTFEEFKQKVLERL